jgi:hypothetical protein
VGQHDLSYRLFFTHRLMIRDLLREIVEEPWVERIDLDSGGLAETSFVSARHENRASDVIWRFQRKDGGEPVHVYILLEFLGRRSSRAFLACGGAFRRARRPYEGLSRPGCGRSSCHASACLTKTSPPPSL